MRKILPIFVSLALNLAILALPQTALSLNSPTKISTSSNEVLAPAVVSDSNGKVHMVWMDATNGWSSATTSLLHSIWNGSTWSSPTTIASGNFHELPSLAADTSGNVYLTWDADTNPAAWQIYYSKWNGSTWSAATAISGATSGDVAWDSEVTIDSAGNPHVAYTFIPAGGSNRLTYYTEYNGASWSTPIDLTQSGTEHSSPTVASDSTGKVHIAWKLFSAGVHEIIHRIDNGSTFSSSVSVSGALTDGADPQPKLTVDKNNNAHVVWEQFNASSNFDVKYSKYTTSWSAPFTVTNIAQQTSQGLPSIGIGADSNNNIYVGWIDKSTSPLKAGFRKYNNSTASWETAQTNNTSLTSADFPTMTIDKWDNLHIAWGELNASNKYELFYDVVPVAVKQVTASTGGSLTTSNNDTMSIPAGSLSSDTLISMQIAPLSFAAPSDYSALPRQYIFEPAGTTFSSPITVVFKYSDAEFSGSAEKNLGIYVWDSTINNWVFKTGTINKPQNTVTITLDHFSIFSLFSAPDTVTWISPLKENLEETIQNEFKLGRTVPLKFQFSEPITDATQVKIQVVDSSANVVADFDFGVGSDYLRYDPTTGQFIANLDTNLLTTGSYQIKVVYQDLLRGSLDFTLE